MEINIEDRCTHCFQPTNPGSLRFVNRIPSGADATLVLQGESYDITVDGWMCEECQQVECDECEKLTLDYEIRDGKILCSECLEEEKS
jgi:hypothetical protein